jgi:hypothetical protein
MFLYKFENLLLLSTWDGSGKLINTSSGPEIPFPEPYCFSNVDFCFLSVCKFFWIVNCLTYTFAELEFSGLALKSKVGEKRGQIVFSFLRKIITLFLLNMKQEYRWFILNNFQPFSGCLLSILSRILDWKSLLTTLFLHNFSVGQEILLSNDLLM